MYVYFHAKDHVNHVKYQFWSKQLIYYICTSPKCVNICQVVTWQSIDQSKILKIKKKIRCMMNFIILFPIYRYPATNNNVQIWLVFLKLRLWGESWGMYITSASTKIANKAEPTLALKPRGEHHQKYKTGVPVPPPKRTCVRQKL